MMKSIFRIKNILRFIIAAVAVTMMALAWVALHNSKRFPITTVKVNASYQHLSHKKLQEIIAPYVTGGFFTIDVSTLRKQLLNIPWVSDVSITRMWPSSVFIKIIERQAVAKWNAHAFIDTQGQLFTPINQVLKKPIPQLVGPDDQQVFVWQMYLQMTQLLSPLNVTICKLDLSARHAWQLQLCSGGVVLFGRKDTMERLGRFTKAYPKVFAGRLVHISTVDLRYSNGLAVKWKK